MRMAGRRADIVWVCFGLHEEEIAIAKGYLEEGAREAGRSVDDIDVWWMIQFNIDDSREAAIDAIKANLASSGHIIFRYGLEGKAVPAEFAEQAGELARRYKPIEHFGNVGLTDELGLTDYLARRLAIVGTPGECVERIKELEGLGVDKLFFYTSLPDKDRLFSRLVGQVMPHVS